MATVGYYDMSLGQGGSYQVNELTGNGHTAVNITVPNAAQLAGIDTLYVTNPSNSGFGSEYLANRTAIANAVSGGMNLVIFDRTVTGANTILPGGTSISVVRNTTSGATDINIAAGAPAAFSAGLTNASLDGGNLSSHGYVTLSSLPPGAVPLLTRANANQIVAFTYPYGSGTVFYSTIPLDFYSNANYSSITPAEVMALLNNTINVLCFVLGTQIETKSGLVAVEDLRPGDLVRVLGGGYEPLRWVGQTEVRADQMASTPNLKPVRIRAGAMGAGLPLRDLWVSRQHRMMVASTAARSLTGQAEMLIAACKLTDLPGIEIDDSVQQVVYFHLLFDGHQVIWAEGAPSESLYFGAQTENTLTPAQRHEIFHIFPELARRGHADSPALPILSGPWRKRLVERHLRNGRPLLETLGRGMGLPRSAQGIARPAHRAQRIVAASGHQRLAKAPDMHVNRAAVDVNVAPPNPVKQLLAREHPARALHQAR